MGILYSLLVCRKNFPLSVINQLLELLDIHDVNYSEISSLSF